MLDAGIALAVREQYGMNMASVNDLWHVVSNSVFTKQSRERSGRGSANAVGGT
jgi:hypothetical protein